jgi:hypothetical protein
MRLRTMRLHWSRYGADYRLAAGVGLRIGACAAFAIFLLVDAAKRRHESWTGRISPATEGSREL